MKRLVCLLLIGLALCFPAMEAKELPCDRGTNPVICAFLNRYIHELLTWQQPDVSLSQKMQDDKFIILQGSIENIPYFPATTAFSLVRHEDRAYEAVWRCSMDTLLHVAFPIQYELLLGKSRIEIEQGLQTDISAAPRIGLVAHIPAGLDSIAPYLWRSYPIRHYQIPSLNNCTYYSRDTTGTMALVCDSLYMYYTLANMFQQNLGRDYAIQVSQSVYGFQRLLYTISLQQWLAYCIANHLTSYVAVEEEYQDGYLVLLVAENKDLNYNHILSVLVPRDFLSNRNVLLQAKVSAFVPTHNVADLYEQYVEKPKKKQLW